MYTIKKSPNHTTSTKCQYQIKQSCLIPFLPNTSELKNRTQHKINLTVPTVTWNLWNLVNAKKLDPNTPSLIENTALLYSINWQIKKTTPNKIDNKILFAAAEYSLEPNE